MIRNNILTKHNLLKRDWNGIEQCYFCDQPETVKHLLFDYSLRKFIWRVIRPTFDLDRPPDGVHDLIDDWLDQFPPSQCRMAIMGVTGLC